MKTIFTLLFQILIVAVSFSQEKPDSIHYIYWEDDIGFLEERDLLSHSENTTTINTYYNDGDFEDGVLINDFYLEERSVLTYNGEGELLRVESYYLEDSETIPSGINEYEYESGNLMKFTTSYYDFGIDVLFVAYEEEYSDYDEWGNPGKELRTLHDQFGPDQIFDIKYNYTYDNDGNVLIKTTEFLIDGIYTKSEEVISEYENGKPITKITWRRGYDDNVFRRVAKDEITYENNLVTTKTYVIGPIEVGNTDPEPPLVYDSRTVEEFDGENIVNSTEYYVWDDEEFKDEETQYFYPGTTSAKSTILPDYNVRIHQVGNMNSQIFITGLNPNRSSKIFISSMSGNTVQSWEVENAHQFNEDIQLGSSGMYLLSIIDEAGRISTTKFLVR